MMEQQPVHPLEYLAVVNRRKWWFVVPLVACIAGGVVAWIVWPKTYLSQAAIAIDSPTLPSDFLHGVQSMDPNERQRAVSQLLLSPDVLERVVREEHLSPKKPIADVTESLRADVSENISVPNPVGFNRPDPSQGINLFYLGYTNHNPQRAQEITNRLATVFVQENAKQQTARAAKTSDILAQELSDSSKKLKGFEDQLRAQKEKYVGRLPEQVTANVQMVNGARTELESISMQLSGEQQHLQLVESQLQQMQQGTGAEAVTSSGMASVQNDSKHLDDLDAELASDRALGYTDKHPDVIRLQEEIKEARANVGKSSLPSSREALLKADPIYHAKLQERDAAKIHITELQTQARSMERQIGDYQARVDAAPGVEQQLTALTNQYTLEKTRYDGLTSDYQKAKTAEQVAENQAGEGFRVLFPATFPTSPVSPKAFQVFAVAIIVGLVLGAGAALGREFLDRSVHDVKSLQNQFQVPVLAEIPRIAA